jgi:hypothetical protein
VEWTLCLHNDDDDGDDGDDDDGRSEGGMCGRS